MTLLGALLLAGNIAVYSQEMDAKEQILQRMANQEKCWNSGDLDCFMIGYWESDSLMFVNKDGIIYGFDATLDRYKRTYPDRASMGILKFEIMHLNPLSADAYLVVGKYHLSRDVGGGDLEGYFTLVWKKKEGAWVIIADHSS